jgi:hypothetical protein
MLRPTCLLWPLHPFAPNRPAGIEELCQSFVVLEHKDHSIVFHPHAQTGACGNHLHEGFLLALAVNARRSVILPVKKPDSSAQNCTKVQVMSNARQYC